MYTYKGFHREGFRVVVDVVLDSISLKFRDDPALICLTLTVEIAKMIKLRQI